ncbi:MAG: type II secretion system minor pseudopilin GspH [Gammaproteobacteria bacterium]|nr:type II secretion system minor pseudopilin GspH [Gammaproteobacteria bacterium]
MSARPVSALRRLAGFTLLELMVVLVLIGIIFSFAVLSLRGDDISELMKQETRRLATLLELASDEAILQGDELAVYFSEDGYEFLVLQENNWQSPGDDELLKAYSLPAEIELRLEVEGEPPELNSFAGQEDGDSEEDAGESLTPQIFILSSGEMTAFSVTFMSFQSNYRYHLTVSLLGKVSWEVEETL